MKYTYSIIVFLLFTFSSYAQWYEFNDLNKEHFSREDTLFYTTRLEECTGPRTNTLFLLEILSSEYLLNQINSGHWKSVGKALSILCYSEDENLIPSLAPFIKRDDRYARAVIATLRRINGQAATPYFHQALIDGIGHYKKYDTFLDLLYIIRDFPTANSLQVLTKFQIKIRGKVERDQYLIDLAKRSEVLLRGYLGSETERKQVLSNVFNDEGLMNFSWALHRIQEDNRPEDIKILKESNRQNSIEVLILRRYLGDKSLTEAQQKILEGLPLKPF